MIDMAISTELKHLHLVNGQMLSFQHYGQSYLEAPVVLINHPLTGNSKVTGLNGWWCEMIGQGKALDTNKYAIIAFNIPGNGYDGQLIDNYQDWHAGTIAAFFIEGLKLLGVDKLRAVIGSSIGAGIAWEMATLAPSLIECLVPIGGDWKASDWMIANTFIQDQILASNPNPIEIARMHAMLYYRTPTSFKLRFNRSINDKLGIYNVESWLLHHGKKLKDRFHLKAYKTLNHILGRIDITRDGRQFEEIIKTIQSDIHIVSISSDLFFPLSEDQETVLIAKQLGKKIHHHIIESDYGHDAFLIEHEKVNSILTSLF